MNKQLFLMFLAAILTANVVNAQILVIGSIGFDYADGNKTVLGQTNDLPTKVAFQFTPKVGFVVTNNFAVGLGFGISTSTTTTPKTDINPEIKQTSTGWNVNAFTRLKIVGAEKLTLFLDEIVGIGGVNTKTTGSSNPTEGIIFNIDVVPVLAYNFTERFNIAASSDIFKLGFRSVTSTANKGDQTEEKTKNNSFGIGYNSNNLFDGSSLFKVGLTLKFKGKQKN